MTAYRFKVVVIFIPLREMCPNMKLFLVRIFPHSDWIRREIKNTNLPECRKIRTRNNSVFGQYSSSVLLTYLDAQRWTVFFSCLDFSVNIIKSQVMLTIWTGAVMGGGNGSVLIVKQFLSSHFLNWSRYKPSVRYLSKDVRRSTIPQKQLIIIIIIIIISL